MNPLTRSRQNNFDDDDEPGHCQEEIGIEMKATHFPVLNSPFADGMGRSGMRVDQVES